MKLLVAIASYGTKNDHYLAQLVNEYRSMSFAVDIVVLTNAPKDAGPGVEVMVVDLTGKNPWSLPFPHKQLFAARRKNYDLFLYSEDDTLVTEKNLRAFLEVAAALPESEIPGFLRYEVCPDGSRSFPEVHGHFHWDPLSVRLRGGQQLAYFTNEHAACYVLTRAQLEKAIVSGGFLVEAHQGKYDLLCTAATDPYTQCGMQKLICVSRIDEFLIHHLPNKYVGTQFGTSEEELRRQLTVLVRVGLNGHRPAVLFPTETRLPAAEFSKDYYEPVRPEVMAAIPSTARSVLSLGAGSGATEAALAKRGLRVLAVPLDPVIFRQTDAAKITAVNGDLDEARAKLAGEQVDCLLLSNVLHLAPEPVRLLKSYGELLSKNGMVVALTPNLGSAPIAWKKFRGVKPYDALEDYASSGVRITSHATVKSWLREAGLQPAPFVNLFSERRESLSRRTAGMFSGLLASEFIAVGKKE